MTRPWLQSNALAALALVTALPDSARVPSRPAPVLVPGCAAALPLDAGQAFAGPRFLVWGDRITFFAEGPGPAWRRSGVEHLPASPPAVGMARARVKWRDDTLWMKAGTRVFRRDPASGAWLPAADPGLDFRDFDVDLRGRILLIGTSDPRTRRYRALVERANGDGPGAEVLCEYPDPDYQGWFDRISPVAAATLLTGYESVQIQEYLVLFNPLARRAFIYEALTGRIREARLGLPVRGVRDLETQAGRAPDPPGDLCWQVLPRGASEAWVICPAPGSGTGEEAPRLQAISLDLVDGRGADPVDLGALRLPLFQDPHGRLMGLGAALDRFK